MAELAELEGYEELVVQLLVRAPRSKGPGLVAKLPATWFAAGLTAKQFAALPAEKLAWLTAKQLAALPAEKLAGLTAKQLAGLTAEQLAALPAEKVMAGRSVRERLAGLSPDELKALRAELGGPPPAKAKPKRRAKATR